MRISAGRAWLLAALCLGTANSDAVEFQEMTFTGSDPANPQKAIFSLTDETAVMSKNFSWLSPGIRVNEIRLFYIDDNNLEKQIGNGTANAAAASQAIGSGNAGGLGTASAAGTGATPERRQFTGTVNGIPLTVDSTENGGVVFFTNQTNVLAIQSVALYFEAVWPNGDGKSYSRAFTFVDVARLDLLTKAQQNPILADPNPRHTEVNTTLTTGIAPIAGTTTGTFSTTTSTSTSSTTAVAVPEADKPAGGSAGGLSIGAIVGIAVGAGVAGLAVIAGIILLIMRRRRRQQSRLALGGAADPYGTDRHHRPENLIMAEKEEASAGVDVDGSPHSPYSDDGVAVAVGGGVTGTGTPYHEASLHQTHPTTIIPPVVAAPSATPVAPVVVHRRHPAAQLQQQLLLQQQHQQQQHQQQQHQQQHPSSPIPPEQSSRSYTPYSDRPTASRLGSSSPQTATAVTTTVADETMTTTTTRSAMASPVPPGRVTPHGVSAQYAHLVEEGMTEDELYRLEEEERQLDAAIEQSSSGRGAGGAALHDHTAGGRF
ncbi:hypothetical protein B0T26DRAFT_17676 [Lasiosphaeria miniovina]|uniref:Mid2 domain-containing protein n=1 Tax=Lasiosphaeria miniovina TaxID=1954250 RepID=A0AA40BFP9_9PEZI|nr:uncharacterized protein B0T26DRAFT_17676 [Lasiosphaeria miniovina]KAK0733395.1 hypothetical protein B0T26DRAFT_17676 [Lasiosphaeria miniovina]